MNALAEALLRWLVDYYLLATLLLGATLVASWLIVQPARRVALARAALVGLALLALLCALPGWSVVHLMTREASAPATAVSLPTMDTEFVAAETTSIEAPLELTPLPPTPDVPSAPVETQTAAPFSSAIRVADVVAVAYMCGMFLIVAWQLLGHWRARTLVNCAMPASAELQQMLMKVGVAGVDSRESSAPTPTLPLRGREQDFLPLGGRGPDSLTPRGRARVGAIASHATPRLLISPQLTTAVALGTLRPTILLPQRLVETADPTALRTILAHELAHICHGDLRLLALCRALFVLLWANPLFWLVRRRLRLDQETLADAAAAQVSSRHRYAEQLVDWAKRFAIERPPALAAAVGLWESPSQLRHRIAVLLDERLTIWRKCSRRWRLASLAVCAGVAVGLSLVTLEPGTPSQASAAEDTPAAEEEAQNTPAKTAMVPMESLRVRVADDSGEPIEGVIVTPYGMRAGNDGSHYGWHDGTPGNKPQPATTDESGTTTVRYPRYVMEKVRTDVVSLKFDHPEYVSQTQDVAVESADTPVVLARGGVVEIHPNLDDATPQEHVFGMGGDRSSVGWTRLDDGTLRSPQLAAGRVEVRAVGFSKEGLPHFSPVERVELRKGETKAVHVTLRPGTKLTGRLDDNVPRPVVDGKVVASVDSPGNTGWQDWTTVREDGTFEFASLPRDEGEIVQLIAICEGYVSKPPVGVENEGFYGKPQTAALGGETVQHVIDMIPTAMCVARLKDPAGRPIANAKVTLNPSVVWTGGGSSIFAHPLSRSSDYLRNPEQWSRKLAEQYPYQATTDDDGFAHLENLPPFAPSWVSVQHEKFQLPLTGRLHPHFRMAEVKLEPGQLSELDLTLEAIASDSLDDEPGGAETRAVEPTELAGTVLDSDAKPLAGVTVDAWTWYPGNETTTDEKGQFSLKGFDAGSQVEVEFRKEGFGPRHFVDKPTGTEGWIVRMDNRTYFEGTMTDRDGKPVAGAVIRAERGPFENPGVVIGEVPTETMTNERGEYRLYLESDTYDIKVRVPDRGVARYQRQRIGFDQQKQFDIRLEPGVTFRAKIIDSKTGEPVEGVTLWNWRLKGIEGTSNSEGLLEIPAMFPGKFEFNVTAVGDDRHHSRGIAGNYARWWSDEAVQKHQRAQELDRHSFQRNFDDLEFDVLGNTEPVTIFVEPCVTIMGRVIDPEGSPVAGATVAPAKTGSGNSLTGDTRFSYETREDGTFEMKLPASGGPQYNLIAHDGKYQEWRKWANATGQPMSSLPGDRIDGVELRLARPATIRGQVLDEQARPVAGKRVRAADFHKRDNRYYHPTTTTDDKGNFELEFVGPGKHSIQSDPFWLAESAPPGTHAIVEVKEGETIEGVMLHALRDPGPGAVLIGPLVPGAVDGEGDPEFKDDLNKENEAAGGQKAPAVAPTNDSGNVDAPGATPQPNAIAGQRIDLPIVVAKHVVLLDGKEIITWTGLEDLIAAMPDPSLVHPRFYVTRGAREAGLDVLTNLEIRRLRERFNLKGHSEGSLWPRADVRYDRIEDESDLVPDESLRVGGRVVDRDGKPVANAEVILITPVDESISYKTLDIALVEGHVRNRLEEVITDSDSEGRFAIYPPGGEKYYVVAMHPTAGFNLARGQQFVEAGEVKLFPWAALVSELGEEPGMNLNQSASIRTRLAAEDGYPEIVFSKYWSDLKNKEPTKVFTFSHIPPIFETTIDRSFADAEGTSIGLPGASIGLLPGETRRLDLGPLSEKQREHLEERRAELRRRLEASHGNTSDSD